MDALNAGKSVLLAAVLVAPLLSAPAETTCYQTRFTIHCDNGLSASKEGRSTYWSDGVTEHLERRGRTYTTERGDRLDRDRDEFERLRDQRK
jgi:hypothetical protein